MSGDITGFCCRVGEVVHVRETGSTKYTVREVRNTTDQDRANGVRSYHVVTLARWGDGEPFEIGCAGKTSAAEQDKHLYRRSES